jgi:hypothetical protein
MDIIQTGRFPHAESLEGAQQKFTEQRKKGYFNPIVGGIPMIEDDNPSEPVDEQKVPGVPGRPPEKDLFSRSNIQETVYKIEGLIGFASSKMQEKLKVKKLNKQQNEMMAKLCESVVCSSEKENWEEQVISCVNNYTNIEKLATLNEVFDISEKHKLEIYPSAILYHSNERN